MTDGHQLFALPVCLFTHSSANSKIQPQKQNSICIFLIFQTHLAVCQVCRQVWFYFLHISCFQESHTVSCYWWWFGCYLVVCLFVSFEIPLYFHSTQMVETYHHLKLHHPLLQLGLTLWLALFWWPDHMVWRPNVCQTSHLPSLLSHLYNQQFSQFSLLIHFGILFKKPFPHLIYSTNHKVAREIEIWKKKFG